LTTLSTAWLYDSDPSARACAAHEPRIIECWFRKQGAHEPFDTPRFILALRHRARSSLKCFSRLFPYCVFLFQTMFT
jgi:hypothetical protein